MTGGAGELAVDVIGSLPPALRARFSPTRAQRLATALRNESIAAALDEILDAAATANLPMLPLKGAVLAFTIYGDAGLRPMRDVDVLVRPRDLPRAIALLESLGFIGAAHTSARWGPRHAHAVGMVDRRRQLALDLHHRLFHELGGDGDGEPFFLRAIAVDVAGKSRAVPSWDDALFLAALHGAVDGFGGSPFWMLDFLLLLARADFAVAAREAERRRLTVAFSAAVMLARRALPELVPPHPSPAAWRRALLDVTLGSDPLITPPSQARNLAARLLLADGVGGIRELARKVELRAVEAVESLRRKS